MNPWTPEVIAELTAKWAAGHSGGQIAVMFGMTRSAVIGKVKRLGLINPVVKQPFSVAGAWHRQSLRVVRPKKINAELTELPVEQPHELLAPPVSLDALEKHHCRWPLTGEDGKTWYCGCQKLDGFSYCLPHAEIAYQRPPTWSDAQRAKAAVRARKRVQAMALRRAAA